MYEPNVLHRNGNPHKSQWIITEAEEIVCFENSRTNEWLADFEGWGLHCPGGIPIQLGTVAVSFKESFIAKFVKSRSTTPQVAWHGYPTDHQNKAQDIPNIEVLKSWLDMELMGRAKIRKISKGQPCRL